MTLNSFYNSSAYWIFSFLSCFPPLTIIIWGSDWIEFIISIPVSILLIINSFQFARLDKFGNTPRDLNQMINTLEDTATRSLIVITASLASYFSYNIKTIAYGLGGILFMMMVLISIFPLSNEEMIAEISWKLSFRLIALGSGYIALIKTIVQKFKGDKLKFLGIPLVDTKYKLKHQDITSRYNIKI